MDDEKTKLIRTAERHLEKGSLRRAIGVYRKVLRLDPQDLRSQLKIGDLYARSADIDSATPIFRAVAEHYAGQGQFLKATAVYKRLAELEPNVPHWALKLADSYRQQGLRNDAADQFRRAIFLYGQAGDAQNLLGTVKQLLSLDANNVAGRVRLAEAFSRGGWIDEAAEQYRLCCRILRRRGNRSDFARCAERLLYHDPSDFDVAKEVAHYYIEQDQPQLALPKLHRCYKLKPRDVEILELLVDAFELLNQSHKAVVILKALAAIYEQSGLQNEYREVMSRVLEFEPDDEEARSVFQAQTAPKVSTEIVFEAGEASPAPTAPKEDPNEDEERGFDELEELMRSGDVPSSAESASMGAPLLTDEMQTGEPRRQEPQELSLSGVNLEDITADAVADLVSSIPIIDAIDSHREDLPFDSDDFADAEVVDSSVVATSIGSHSDVLVSAEMPFDAPESRPAADPEFDRTLDVAGPGGGPAGDDWYDEDDRTLVDHQLTPEETTLVDRHIRKAGLAADESVSIVRPPQRGAAGAPGRGVIAMGAGTGPDSGDAEPVADIDWPVKLHALDRLVDQGALNEALSLVEELEASGAHPPELAIRAKRIRALVG